MPEVWIWQSIVSPHMAHLAESLARQGCKVVYVAEQSITPDRQQQGWQAPKLQGVSVYIADSDIIIKSLACEAPAHAMHICQGIRANGRIAIAERELSARGLKYWVTMEAVDDSGWRGFPKRLYYSQLFRSHLTAIQGLLAIGYRTTVWVTQLGMPAERVFPFAYFLPQPKVPSDLGTRSPGLFRIIFVGRLIPLKRVDRLIDALAGLVDNEFELFVVGSGPEEPVLRTKAANKLGNRVRWLGRQPIEEVPNIIAQADCLVLPSRHDGWGAVVSEALMVGTSVICSDACGAAGVVMASGFGGVFPSERQDILRAKLAKQIKSGPVNVSSRKRLATWASTLGADAGANYLLSIFEYSAKGGTRPTPPWSLGSP